MVYRPVVSDVLGVALALAIAATGLGEPPEILGLVRRAQLSKADSSAIKVYADHWVNQLAAAREDRSIDASDAHDQLVKPLLSGGTSATFRHEYATCLLGPLKMEIKVGVPDTTINSIRVLAALGTVKAF